MCDYCRMADYEKEAAIKRSLEAESRERKLYAFLERLIASAERLLAELEESSEHKD